MQVFEYREEYFSELERRRAVLPWITFFCVALPFFGLGLLFGLFCCAPLALILLYSTGKQKPVERDQSVQLHEGELSLVVRDHAEPISLAGIWAIKVQDSPALTPIKFEISYTRGTVEIQGLKEMKGFGEALLAAKPQATVTRTVPWLDTSTLFCMASAAVACSLAGFELFSIILRLGWSRELGWACTAFSLLSLMRKAAFEGSVHGTR